MADSVTEKQERGHWAKWKLKVIPEKYTRFQQRESKKRRRCSGLSPTLRSRGTPDDIVVVGILPVLHTQDSFLLTQ